MTHDTDAAYRANADDIAEEQDVLEMYAEALGMTV